MPRATNRISGPTSRALFAIARRVIPGGVNSPVRAWSRLGGQPPVIAAGTGAWLVDADGQRFCDYVLSWGPLLHGHAHPAVIREVVKAARRGLSFGACTAAEGTMAQVLCDALPGMDQVRLVNSGTEATMSALRLARAVTGRDLVIKCDGCYHGHADGLLVAAGSGCATLNQPDSAGVPLSFAEQTLSIPYNDLKAAASVFARHRGRIAALIIEPVAGNMGLILPTTGYLAGLRQLCTRHGALLIFDEVMTGFRAAWGGYQVTCGVTPDLTCLGKVIGGGMPVGAYGGRRALMQRLAPVGDCYQAGTLSGNPVAIAAGLATLALARRRGFYQRESARLTRLLTGLRQAAQRHGIALQLSQAGTMWGFCFSDRPVINLTRVQESDLDRWKRFTLGMLAEGVYLAPSPFEAAFWSSAHGDAEIRHTVAAADRVLATLA